VTLYGRLQVTEIKLQRGELEIRGRRTGLVNDADCLSDYEVGQSPLKLPEPIGNIVTIRIQISSPDEIQSAIAKVFALTEDDLLASLPDLWKDYVRSRLDPHSHDGQWEFTQGQADIARFSNTPSPVVATGPATGATEAKATPPKPLFTPGPNYAGKIGHALVRGLDKIGATIDEHGNVASLAVIDPIGLGVDESAVEAIQRWKFEPGHLNSKPVAINMILEMSYKLLK